MTKAKKDWKEIKSKKLNDFTLDQWWEEGRKELENFIQSLLKQQREEIIKEALNAGYDKESKTYSPDAIFEYLKQNE